MIPLQFFEQQKVDAAGRKIVWLQHLILASGLVFFISTIVSIIGFKVVNPDGRFTSLDFVFIVLSAGVWGCVLLMGFYAAYTRNRGQLLAFSACTAICGGCGALWLLFGIVGLMLAEDISYVGLIVIEIILGITDIALNIAMTWFSFDVRSSLRIVETTGGQPEQIDTYANLRDEPDADVGLGGGYNNEPVMDSKPSTAAATPAELHNSSSDY